MPSGTIIKGIGGFYHVSSDDGGIYECKARGIFRKIGLVPLAGDRVLFSVTDQLKKHGVIDEVKERRMVLTRPAVANVDQLIAVVAVRSPEPDMLLLDKLLVTAGKKGIGAAVCINKIDLGTGDAGRCLAEPFARAGYRIVKTSSADNMGFDDLKKVLEGHVSVFAGQSGVGKSTILNRIMNTMIMRTGELSCKTGRGKHTTRHAELVELSGGGFVADTPGFSSFELSGIESGELKLFYPEFAEYNGCCRFKGCSHVCEPGCAVKEAVANLKIDNGRYERYVELFNFLRQNEETKCRKGMRKKDG